MPPMVLVIGEDGDWSADAVTAELDARGVAYWRLDTADFPQRMRFTASFERAWSGRVETNGRTLRLEEVSAVYYRKPRDFDPPQGLSGPERRFARAQARVGIGGVLTSLAKVRWVNAPSVIADHEYKPAQLRQARACGLETPPTLITSVAADVREFARRVGGELVVKPLAEPIVHEAGGHTAVYTRRLGAADLDDLAGVEATTHLFQPFLPKLFEARITVVGTRLFTVAIHAGSEAGRIDWRSDYPSLRYEVIDCPPHVAEGLRQYMAAVGLRYAAFDFIITPDSPPKWIFLECNASGQWGWLSEECGLPIATALADELVKESP